MATNVHAPGEVLTFTAPAGGVVSGQPYLVGSLLVIATHNAVENAVFSAEAGPGVYLGQKSDAEAWTEGAKIYFDATASPDPLFTTDDASGANPLVGCAIEDIPASPPVATGRVRLDGVAR